MSDHQKQEEKEKNGLRKKGHRANKTIEERKEKTAKNTSRMKDKRINMNDLMEP